MNEDYLWEREGEPDAFSEALERGLAPLGEEADALIEGLDLNLDGDLDLSLDGELGGPRDEGVVVRLPSAGERALGEGEAALGGGEGVAGRSWLWMGAAAALLLALSASVLVGEQRRRAQLREPIGVGGGASPRARIGVAVQAFESDGQAGRLDGLVALRPLHHSLATCARAWAEAEAGEQSVALRLELDLKPGAVSLVGSEFDGRPGPGAEALARCMRSAVEAWQPQGLGAGVMTVRVTIEE
ncbi:hypothetical protein G6O69_34780 [Pseudenhygromyxa sp. WMMC2535]|uniref:hypothetical protein n=1 Tax=Pseudenhygromyxa sp. WMMC2535 TaxID=2712867 RepID=UPI001554C271|nr:hypothetical protein [Pseudenhygromyxa sp. WMMC2535]NVB43040.1 hypothetical protein [Pseudenhygromyxa sp. WMMC2535]